MYDFSFSRRSLDREINESDFLSLPVLYNKEIRKNIIEAAERDAENGFSAINLDHSRVKGRDLYRHGTFSKEIILRKLSRNIKVLTKTRQSNRDEIVTSLSGLLSEGEDFTVHKIDIKEFFPSIDRNTLDDGFCSDQRFPSSSHSVFKNFSKSLENHCILGLPAGLSISATLAEYYMREFDHKVARIDGVYYYARFVDDIIILSSGKDDETHPFLLQVQGLLPNGLRLNDKKSKSLHFSQSGQNSAQCEGSVDFLGYSFSVSKRYKNEKNKFERKVDIDISRKKSNRIKTKLILSLIDYINDPDFLKLESRMRVISGNYHIYDFEKCFRRKVGIYYNYHKINLDVSPTFSHLDRFWRGLLLSRSGRVCAQLYPLLSTSERKRLLKYSFQRSFNSKTHYHYNHTRLAELTECWKYE